MGTAGYCGYCGYCRVLGTVGTVGVYCRAALATGPVGKCRNTYFPKSFDVVIISPAAPAAGKIATTCDVYIALLATSTSLAPFI